MRVLVSIMSRKNSDLWTILKITGMCLLFVPLGILCLLCYPLRKLADEIGTEKIKEFKRSENHNNIDKNGKKRI